METFTPLLLVTANVGSIFENPDVMLGLWIHEFLMTVSRSKAKFIALHCQEVGGKNYEIRMPHVQNFIQLLVSSKELQSFDKMEIFIDEDFSCAENFTALGCFYFIHEDITDIFIWDFEKLKLEPVKGKNIYTGNIEDISIKEKSKFPQTFFPECKWSRKGFLRTRWSLNGTVFDLVNIHLFHDASNLIAMQTFPSAYTVMRQKALQYTLTRFYNYEDGSAPFFLFGDFNFRTDTQAVIKKLVSGLSMVKEESNINNDSTKLQYKDNTSETILTLGKKEFNHFDHQNIFVNDSGEWLKEFDRELEAFDNQLYEFPVSFVPSYPFEENCSIANEYMKTRCPAWCDRVLLSINAKQLVHEINKEDSIEYGIIGSDTCMGDHKPVFLRLNLVNNAGTVLLDVPVRILCPVCNKLFSNVYNSTLLKHAFSNHTHDSNAVDYMTAFAKRLLYKSRRDRSSTSINSNGSNNNNNKLSLLEFPEDLLENSLENGADLLSCNHSIISKDRDICRERQNDPGDVLSPADGMIGVSDRATDLVDELSLSVDDKQKPLRLSTKRLSDDSDVKPVSSSTFVIGNDLPSQFDSSSINTWKNTVCADCDEYQFKSASMSDRLNSWSSCNRIKLKSDPELKRSLRRIESHHSSSEEEWFEDDAEGAAEVSEHVSFSNVGDIAGTSPTSTSATIGDQTQQQTLLVSTSHLRNEELMMPLTLTEECANDDKVSFDRESSDRTAKFCFCFPKKKKKKKTNCEKCLTNKGVDYKFYHRQKSKRGKNTSCTVS